MNRNSRLALAGAAVLCAASASRAAFAAKLTMEEAKVRALRAVPGEVVKQEHENEHGRDIYSFEIRPTGENEATAEVAIDANDGSVVAIDHDDDKEGEGDRD